VDRDINVVHKKTVSGVAQLLASIREQNDVGLIDQGKKEVEELEPGAVPSGPEDEGQFTLAEEIKRQIRREEKKKRKGEEFKIAVSTCRRFPNQSPQAASSPHHLTFPDKPADNSDASGDPYRTLFVARLVGTFSPFFRLPSRSALLDALLPPIRRVIHYLLFHTDT
jgi:U1 small nuclear ribonucleoprotein 70kDa